MVGEITKRDTKKYLIVTPVKNEEKYLPNLIQSIKNQTIKPLLWVIVDDRSTDNTPDIINKEKENNKWIQDIRLEESVRDRGVHLAKSIKIGFDFAYDYCEKNGIEIDYLGNVDADVVLENTYYERLIEKFENDKMLGIVSGGEWFIKGENKIYYGGRYPSGGDVLFRKKCLEDCGGIPLIELWDSVINTKAKLKGWGIQRFDDSRAFIMRGYSHADGLWSGYEKTGKSEYILNYNYFYALAKGFALLFREPGYPGFAYLYGYISSLMLRKKQINDKEIRYYFMHTRPKEINQHYFEKVKKYLFKKK